MAVPVDLEHNSVGIPKALFGGPYDDAPASVSRRSYDVSRDGERFLMVCAPPEGQRRHILVTLDWTEKLKAKTRR